MFTDPSPTRNLPTTTLQNFYFSRTRAWTAFLKRARKIGVQCGHRITRGKPLRLFNFTHWGKLLYPLFHPSRQDFSPRRLKTKAQAVSNPPRPFLTIPVGIISPIFPFSGGRLIAAAVAQLINFWTFKSTPTKANKMGGEFCDADRFFPSGIFV